MTNARPADGTLTRFVRRHLLMLLVLTFGVATFWPQPGLQLRAPLVASTTASTVHLMLAILLFTLGISTKWSRLRESVGQLKWLGVSLLVRAVTCLAVVVLLHWLPPSLALACVGYVLILAMPAAASSSGWCLQLASSQSVCLVLIVGTTLASAVSTPLLLSVSRAIAPDHVNETLSAIRSAYDFGFVLPWVIVPTLLGITVRGLHTSTANVLQRIGRAANPFVLLLLNYANASSSLPQLREGGVSSPFVAVVGGCVLLFAAVSFATIMVAQRLRSNRPERVSALLGTAMSNTGLALVIATVAVPGELGLHVAVIAYTLVQHLGVAVLAKKRWPRKVAAQTEFDNDAQAAVVSPATVE